MKKLLTVLPLVLLLCFAFGCQKGEEAASPAEASEEIQIETGYAEVNGTRLYYEVAGSGDAILFIHGNGGDRRHWDEQFEVFAKDYRVVRFDVRGFGKSAVPVEGESYRCSDDIKALLEFLGISKAHVAGFSLGCGFAVDFVIEYPEMSRSLIAVGPWIFGYRAESSSEMVSSLADIPKILEKEGKMAAYEYWMNSPFFKDSFRDPTVYDRVMEIGKDFTFWHFTHEDPIQYLDPVAAEQLDKIELPTLIVTAEYDLKPCREMADHLEKSIPNSKKIELMGTGHLMALEKPAEFNKAVLDFLKDLEPAKN
jgi:pimeloyl-ACP methyl ester carboxylesterase